MFILSEITRVRGRFMKGLFRYMFGTYIIDKHGNFSTRPHFEMKLLEYIKKGIFKRYIKPFTKIYSHWSEISKMLKIETFLLTVI